jgi:drug/metabolite transporter (DMT)-like permease
MNTIVLLLIVSSITLSAVAQIALKHGMSAPEVQSALAAHGAGALVSVASNAFVWIGLALYGAGAVLWLGVLARVDVSQAYPFVGLGFILTMLFAVAFLGEPLSFTRIAGTLLIVAGVVFVARG